MALGQAGIEDVNGLIVKEAHRFGFVDEGVISADTTAQELPIGYPNEPGILRGLSPRRASIKSGFNPKGNGLGRLSRQSGSRFAASGVRPKG